ncbi:MAG: hypothetical protein EP329_07475, partial [Deltaproteobacteria bacterium]
MNAPSHRLLLATALIGLAGLAAGCGSDPGAGTDTTCVPECGDRVCGFDPVCGTSCGICAAGAPCDDGQCVAACVPKTCAEVGVTCGAADDGCGGTLACDLCAPGTRCEGDACAAVTWPARSCDLTVAFTPEPGATAVALAHEANGWSDTADPMADPDGDGVFTVTLSPGDALVSGYRYAYKVVVDGAWFLDPASTLRKYHGVCLNSAFELPDCNAGPTITVLAADVDAAARTADVRFTLETAADGAQPDAIRVLLDGAEVHTSAVTTSDDPLEIAVHLANFGPGKHRVSLRATDSAGRAAEPVDLPLWFEETDFDWRDSTLYMILIDRFANGRTDDDAPVGDPVLPPADWHGGDLWGAAAAVEDGYFDRLGVDVIWLSPVNRQVNGHFLGRDDGRDYSAYHGYWPVRGREVDPRYGGDDALHAFVDAAHAHGIRVLLDLINNQVHEQHTYYWQHPDWFRGECVCGIDPGCDWSERPLDCLFASYLPDINWRVRAAEDQFIADALFWVDAFDVDGFRIDAVKHVETNSIYNLRAQLARRFEQGGARHYLVGETAVDQSASADYGCDEVYEDGYSWVDAYVGPNALDGQFDFPTHHRMQESLLADTLDYDVLETVVADAAARYRSDALHVTFLGTHDSSRMASLAAVDPARYCTWPEEGGDCAALPGVSDDAAVYARLARAMTLLFTLPGRPLVYYGDEVALPGGRDPDNRRDMPWTGDLAALALSDTALSDAQLALRDRVAALGTARRESLALRRGQRFVLLAEPTLYVYGYATADPTAD